MGAPYNSDKEPWRMKRIPLFILGLLVLTTALWAERPEDRLKSLCDTLLAGLPDSLGEARVAVIPFTWVTGQQKSDQGLAVAEYFTSRVAKDKRLKLVDRTQFQKVVAELALSQSGMVDESNALQAGRLLSANYLLTGTITDVLGMSRVSTKIISTETTEIVSSASIAFAPAELQGLTKELLGEKMQVSASVFRSLLLPGWGQFYSRKYARGGVGLALCLGGLGTTIVFAQQSAEKKRAWNNYRNTYGGDSAPTKSAITEAARRAGTQSGPLYIAALAAVTQKTATLHDAYSATFDRMVLTGAITGGLWTLNVLDAMIAGIQEKQRFRPYFAYRTGREIETGLAIRF
jgi:TolB-like protein